MDKNLIFARDDEDTRKCRPCKKDIGIWLFFSAVPSAFLAVTSAFLTEDIAAMPFLWAMPLGVFMFAFSLPFAPKPIVATNNNIHYVFSAASLLGLLYVFIMPVKTITPSIVISLAAVFYITWICVSGLIKNKPHAGYLHYFYVSLAVGGFLGNFFVSVISPVIFDIYYERWGVVIFAFFMPVLLSFTKDKRYWIFERKKSFYAEMIFAVLIFTSASVHVWNDADNYFFQGKRITAVRSMYGVIRVTEHPDYEKGEMFRFFYNGNTEHGYQKRVDGKLSTETTLAYYDPEETAVSILFDSLKEKSEKDGVKEVAVIGLGTGAMNYFNDKGVHITYYEIDKNSETVAKKYFTYMDMENGENDVVIGDGRLLLSRTETKYDMIIVDAFNGVSIPRHLLTVEAVNLYREKLKEDGVIAFHCSNRYLFVENILNLSVYKNNLYCYLDSNFHSTWVIASEKPVNIINNTADEFAYLNKLERKTWTDDYTPIFPFLYYQ